MFVFQKAMYLSRRNLAIFRIIEAKSAKRENGEQNIERNYFTYEAVSSITAVSVTVNC